MAMACCGGEDVGGNSNDEKFGGNMSQRYIWREGERYAESAPNKMAHHTTRRRVTQNPRCSQSQPMMDDIIDEALFATIISHLSPTLIASYITKPTIEQ